MYRQHSVNKNKTSGLNLKKLIRNTLITAAVVEAAALPFLDFTFVNFLLVFLISLVPAILSVFIRSSFFESSGNSTFKEHKPKTVNPELLVRSNSKSKNSKLVVLEHKNFNWNIEDIVKNPEVKELINTQTVNKQEEDFSEIKKRYNPYRSPFEPINPVIDIKEEVDLDTDFCINTGDEILEPVEEYFEPQDSMIINNEYTKSQTDRDEAIQCTAAAIELKEELSQELYKDIVQETFQDTDDYMDDGDLNCDGEDDVNSTNSVQDDRKVLKLVFKQKEIEIKPPVTKEPVFNKPAVQKEQLPYTYPDMGLLKKQVTDINEEDFNVDIENTANKLIETLASFGVGARVLDVSRGPSVTRYELQPNAGVKVSKIVGLADDIALNLAATGVRIEAPIPGKAAVGIEVPNKEVKAVLLRDVIETKEFLNHSSKLAFAVGKDVAGRIVVGDIAKMPHLLIAGATGSGKSVCINTLIASILYKASPKEVKLLMVDPKVVELGIYNGIPHLLIPVVTDPKKAAGALSWAVVEMTTRYKLFAENNARDLKGYNALMKERGEELLPHIVIIIDELADLMMVAPNDVEDCICRLAQMARAAGMHLVIATQRPSVDVITGVIKANIPSRISFAVSSQIDSRTILDMAGAEKLLGRGDMLYYPIGEPKPVRLQGGFISDKEVEEIVSHIKSNFQAEYDQDVLDKINCQPDQQHDINDDDELLPQAVEMAFANGQASASLMQRKFKVGYSRAARILDQMESWGVVGPAEGSKPRQLLITKQEWDELNS